jgi:hypothetical protein
MEYNITVSRLVRQERTFRVKANTAINAQDEAVRLANDPATAMYKDKVIEYTVESLGVVPHPP